LPSPAGETQCFAVTEIQDFPIEAVQLVVTALAKADVCGTLSGIAAVECE
jgi:hypothetical protein